MCSSDLNDAPTDIRGFNPGVAAGLIAFLERALAKNPQARFQTGEEFAGALRAALSGAIPTTTVDISL